MPQSTSDLAQQWATITHEMAALEDEALGISGLPISHVDFSRVNEINSQWNALFSKRAAVLKQLGTDHETELVAN